MDLSKEQLWTAMTEPLYKNCSNCKHYNYNSYCSPAFSCARINRDLNGDATGIERVHWEKGSHRT